MVLETQQTTGSPTLTEAAVLPAPTTIDVAAGAAEPGMVQESDNGGAGVPSEPMASGAPPGAAEPAMTVEPAVPVAMGASAAATPKQNTVAQPVLMPVAPRYCCTDARCVQYMVPKWKGPPVGFPGWNLGPPAHVTPSPSGAASSTR